MREAYKHNDGQTLTNDIGGKEIRGFISHLRWTALEAIASDTDGVHVAFTADDTEGGTVVTTNMLTMPCSRNITATIASDTLTNIDAVRVKITGLNALGSVITEELPVFTADTAGTVLGNKIFSSVTKIEVPALTGDCSVTVGFGDKLGIPYLLDHNTVIRTCLNNVVESTAPTVAASATAIESNSIDLYSDLDGHIVDVYLIV